MTNAKDELIRVIEKSKILCAEISINKEEVQYNKPLDQNSSIEWVETTAYANKLMVLKIRLFPGYTPKEWVDFLTALDFSYDNGYGTQNLYGTIWMQDGTWLDRYEYDGSESWIWQRLPELPLDFKRVLKIENITRKEVL